MAIIEAKGLDGSTLLGFLASVGCLRLLTEKDPRSCLHFDKRNNQARFESNMITDTDALISTIMERLRADERRLEMAQIVRREMPKDIASDEVCRLAESGWRNPLLGSFLSGLICDGITKAKDKKPDEASETTLCAANGAGHQKMFRTMLDLLNFTVTESGELVQAEPPLVTESHIRKSIFELWNYRDEVPINASWMGDRKPTLRWDEGAERLYALRLFKPTQDPEPFRTELGAYALAAASLPCFPVVPVRRGAQSVFTEKVSG